MSAKAEDVKLLNRIGQHYHHEAGGQAVEGGGPSNASSSSNNAPPTEGGVGTDVASSAASVPTFGAASTAILTAGALLGVAAVAGVTAVRSMQFKTRYEADHKQVVTYASSCSNHHHGEVGGGAKEDDEDVDGHDTGIPLYCINMPAVNVKELTAVLAAHGLATPSPPQRAEGDKTNATSRKGMLTPMARTMTLYNNAGNFTRNGPKIGGGSSGGGEGQAPQSETMGADDGSGAGGEVTGDAGGSTSRLGAVKRGAPVSRSHGVAGRFMGDCRVRVLEAYSKLAPAERRRKQGGSSSVTANTTPTQCPCIAEHFVVLVNDNEPDVFYTIEDVARRFKGQRITLLHCVCLTVDGTHTKGFASAVAGTVTDEWLRTIVGRVTDAMARNNKEEESTTAKKSIASNADADDEDDDDALTDAIRKIPFEVLFQPNATSFVPTTKPDSNNKMAGLRGGISGPHESDTSDALAQLATMVHTSNVLEFTLYNNKLQLDLVSAATDGSGKSERRPDAKKQGGGAFGWLTALSAVLFPSANKAERQQMTEALYRDNVSETSRIGDAVLITADEGRTAAFSTLAIPLFSSRLANYNRLACHLRFDRHADPEHFPLLTMVAKATKGMLIPTDTAAPLSEDSIEPEKLFTLLRDDGECAADVLPPDAAAVATTAAQQPTTSKKSGQYLTVPATNSAANGMPVTPQQRILLNPLDLKRLRLAIGREWEHISKAWAALRSGNGVGPLNAASAVGAITAKQCLLLGDGASQQGIVNQLLVNSYGSTPDAHLHAVFANTITLRVAADADTKVIVKQIENDMPTLWAQAVITINSEEEEEEEEEAIIVMRYNTTGQVTDCITALTEQCRLLALSGFVVGSASLGVLLRQGSIDFTGGMQAAMLIAPKALASSSSSSELHYLSLVRVAEDVEAATKAAASGNADGKVSEEQRRTATSVAVAAERARIASGGVMVVSVCHGTSSSSSSSSAISGGASSATPEGDASYFAKMAANFSKQKHPALAKRGLVPVTDADAADRNRCTDGGKFVAVAFAASDKPALASSSAATVVTTTTSEFTIANGPTSEVSIAQITATCNNPCGLSTARQSLADVLGTSKAQLSYIIFDATFAS